MFNFSVLIQDDAAVTEIAKFLAENVTRDTMKALRSDLSTLLESNNAVFEMMLNAARDQIKGEILLSTKTILEKLGSGPHNLIDDPDVKKIWEDNGWKMSVKCRYFVEALCSHFTHKLAQSPGERADVAPENDAWTLKILSKVNYHAAIGEAVDEDASGFLSVHEVDKFLKRKPKTWSVLCWFAY